MSDTSRNTFINWLRQRHDLVLDEECQAKAALAGGDQAAYGQHMRRKAELLATMAEDAREALAALPESQATPIAQKLKSFSQSAAYGLKLNSLFYMSALLYRDDHKEGEPDNLLVYLQELEGKK